VFGDEEVPEGAAPEEIPPPEPAQEPQIPAAIGRVEGGPALQHVDAPVILAPAIPGVLEVHEIEDNEGADIPLDPEPDGEWEDASDVGSEADSEPGAEGQAGQVVMVDEPGDDEVAGK
jgi:hypothetical protein